MEGNIEYVNVKVGLHQESALSSLLFIIIMDVLASKIDKEPHWATLFAEDLVRCETYNVTVERGRTGDMARPIRKTWTGSQPDKNTIPETMKKYK